MPVDLVVRAGRCVVVTKTVIAFLVLLIVPIAPALAVNIYDVVELSRQGYSENEIIGIIQATDSEFELTSEDIQGLKNLGISLQVIAEMMKRTGMAEGKERRPTVDPRKSSFEPAASPTTAAPDSRSDTYAAPTASVPAPFSVSFIREDATGGHRHVAVELYGAQLLVLRDEGSYASIEDRARAIALRMDAAKRRGQGEFRAVHTRGNDTVVFRDAAGTQELPIVTVSMSDAIAYDVRSESSVTTDLLAMYWSALLSDYWTIAFDRMPPERLRHLHRGEALLLLYSVVRNMPLDTSFSLHRGVQRLPQSIQQHLDRLAYAVPYDFDEDDE